MKLVEVVCDWFAESRLQSDVVPDNGLYEASGSRKLKPSWVRI